MEETRNTMLRPDCIHIITTNTMQTRIKWRLGGAFKNPFLVIHISQKKEILNISTKLY